MRPIPKASPLVEWSYRLSLTGKGLLGLGQLIGGMGLWMSAQGAILRLVDWMTRNEMAQDPNDAMARHVIAWAEGMQPGAQNFYAFYLLGHGALNFGVVVALLLRIRGAYYVSMAVLIGFVIYQMSQFLLVGDPVLLLLTAIDLVVIGLVWLERRQTRFVE